MRLNLSLLGIDAAQTRKERATAAARYSCNQLNQCVTSVVVTENATYSADVRPRETNVTSVTSVASKNGQGELQTLSPAAPDRPHRLNPADAREAHARPWSQAQCERFAGRMLWLMQRGITDGDAGDLAEAMHLRDVRGDDRRLCVECGNLGGKPCRWRCNSRDVGLDELGTLAMLPQRCPGFKEMAP